MKLTAALIVRNELGRYLEPCVNHLLEFVDEIRVLDDGSYDGSYELLIALGSRVAVLQDWPPERDDQPAFYGHAAARNRLLDFTLEGAPTHILAIDGDEFIADGAQLRAACADDTVDAWKLCLEEVWNATEEHLDVRQDGGWKEHDVAMLWRPDRVRGRLRITDRGHATGRVPDAVSHGRQGHACTSLLHFGWVNRAERDERYARYAVGDGGRFHAKRHIESIMWPDDRVRLESREWPEGLAAYKTEILARANRVTV